MPIYLITGKLEPMLPIQIPFVNFETQSGYVIHSIYMFLLLASGYFGTVASELFLITLTIHIAPMSKIFEKAINDLNERQEAIKNSTWFRVNFRNIILMHKEIYL